MTQGPAFFDTGLVELRSGDGVSIIRFGEPGVPALWTERLEAELFAAVDMAASDPESNVICLVARSHFSAGADMSWLRQRIEHPEQESEAAVLARRITRLLDVPQLTVAAVTGHCIGIGLALALTADIRFASKDSSFLTGFGKRGLVAEHATAWLLPRIVGTGVAAEMLLASQPMDAETAYRRGLVNRLVDDLDAEVVEYAESIASSVAPQSIAVMKRQLHRGWSTDFETALHDAAAEQVRSIHTAAAKEGVAAFLEKRSSRFPARTEREN